MAARQRLARCQRPTYGVSRPHRRAALEDRTVTGQNRGDSALNFATTKELTAALIGKKISALELADHFVARIEALDGKLNAVVVRDFERARAAAKAADAALARGEGRPLLGIPIVIKESFDVHGLPTTWGVPAFKEFVAKDDALMVARVRAAGAIILGKTNVPYVLGDWQSFNDIYGTTNNPWDLGRSPGGSSGGSSAALAAGFSPISLGSDIGGSLRVPAHFCGIYAHKPTLNLVPPRGHRLPGTVQRISDLAVVGPMARTAADLELLLDLTSGPDETRAGIAYRVALPKARHTALKDFRVLVIDEHPLLPTAASVRAALDRLAQQLLKAGAKVARQSPLLPDLAASARLYMRLLMAALSERWPEETYQQAQTTAAALRVDDHSLPAERWRGAVMSHRQWAAADMGRITLQQQWTELFREFDVVLCPPLSTTAFPHNHTPVPERTIEIEGKNFSFFDLLVWPEIATTPGLPATAAPIGLTGTGLPVGVQIVGPYLEDRTPLAFAALIERAFGGFVAPSGYAD
jgi:amidase